MGTDSSSAPERVTKVRRPARPDLRVKSIHVKRQDFVARVELENKVVFRQCPGGLAGVPEVEQRLTGFRQTALTIPFESPPDPTSLLRAEVRVEAAISLDDPAARLARHRDGVVGAPCIEHEHVSSSIEEALDRPQKAG